LGKTYSYDYVVLAIDEFDRLVPSEEQLEIENIEPSEFEERVIDFLQELRELLERFSKIRPNETPIPPILLALSHTSYTAQPFYDYITHEHPAIQTNISAIIDLWYTKEEIMDLVDKRLKWGRKSKFKPQESQSYYPFIKEAIENLFDNCTTDGRLYLVRKFLQILGESIHLGIETDEDIIGEKILFTAKEMVEKETPYPSTIAPIEVYSEQLRILGATPVEQVKQVHMAIQSYLTDVNVITGSTVEATRVIIDTKSLGSLTSVYEMRGLAGVTLRLRVTTIKSSTPMDWKRFKDILDKAKNSELVEQGSIVIYNAPNEVILLPLRQKVFLLRLSKPDFGHILMHGILRLKRHDPETIPETVRVMRETIKDTTETFLSTIREITSQVKIDTRHTSSWKAIILSFIEQKFQPITLEDMTSETSVVAGTLTLLPGKSKSIRRDDLRILQSSGLISSLFGGLTPTFPSSLVRIYEEYIKTGTLEKIDQKKTFGDSWRNIRSFLYKVGLNQSPQKVKIRTWDEAHQEFKESLSKLSVEDPLHERLTNIEKICTEMEDSIAATNIHVECLSTITLHSAKEIADNYLKGKPEQKEVLENLKNVEKSLRILKGEAKGTGIISRRRLETIMEKTRNVKKAPTKQTVNGLIKDVRGMGDYLGDFKKKDIISKLPIPKPEVKKELDLLGLIETSTTYKTLSKKVKEYGVKKLEDLKDVIWEHFKKGKLTLSTIKKGEKK